MIRLATRAIILQENKLLLVNAYKGSNRLWCAPGGGAERHQSLPDNVKREVYEETGLVVEPGEICLINEFHDPQGTFHQVDLYFRCTIKSGQVSGDWTDPEGIVSSRRWVTRDELETLSVKPDSLADVAWGTANLHYDPLEPIVR